LPTADRCWCTTQRFSSLQQWLCYCRLACIMWNWVFAC